MGLAGDRAREQRLAGAGRSGQQHPVRHPATETLIRSRVAQKVHDLGQLGLGLVDPRHVGKRDADPCGIDPARLRAAEAPQPAQSTGAAALRPAGEQYE